MPAKRSPQSKPALFVRADQAWLDWLEEAAQYFRTDVSKMVDAAVADYAKRGGFTSPPPPRWTPKPKSEPKGRKPPKR